MGKGHRMNWKKKLPLVLLIVAAVSLIGSLLLLFLAAPRANAEYKKVLIVIAASLMLLLSGLVLYYLWIIRDAEPNFFLYDREKNRNVAVENLSFHMVNDRMTFYVSLVSDSPEDLWTGEALERERTLGYRRIYRPLLAYKMLFDLADKDLASYWSLLLKAEPAVINSLCSALEQSGEVEMVKAFRFIMDNYRDTPEKVKDFVCCNVKYIRGRMLAYIKKNIELFY